MYIAKDICDNDYHYIRSRVLNDIHIENVDSMKDTRFHYTLAISTKYQEYLTFKEGSFMIHIVEGPW